jgi:hypothetical protein
MAGEYAMMSNDWIPGFDDDDELKTSDDRYSDCGSEKNCLFTVSLDLTATIILSP